MTRGFAALLVGVLTWFLASRVIVQANAREVGFAVSLLVLTLAVWWDAQRCGEESRLMRGLRVLASLCVSAVITCDAMHSLLRRPAFSKWTLLLLASIACLGFATRLAWERMHEALGHEKGLIERRVTRVGVFVLWAAALVALNVVIFSNDLKVDVSFSPATRPSAHVVTLVDKLDEPLEIVLFLDPTDALWPALAPYFSALRALSSDISVRVTEAAREPTLVREHRVRGNGWGIMRVGERAEVFEVGRDLAAARSTLKMLDAHVANHLSALLVEARRVYLTSGHGERSVLGDVEESRGRRLSDFARLLARFNLRLSSLGVSEGLGRDVPSDAALVLVLGPERAFLPEEAAALERYVARGGSLWLALEPSLDVGLASLLGRLGVSLSEGVVLCRESHLVRNRSDADRELIVARDFKPHPITKLLQRAGKRDGVVFVRAGALRIERAGRDVTAASLLSAPEDCFVDLDGDFQQNQRESDAAPSLMASWADGQGAKVFVVADGDVSTDQVLRNDANTFVTMGALSWLVASDALQVPLLLDKEMPVVHKRSEDGAFFYATAFTMPAALFAIAFALLRCRSRASARGVQRSE